MKNNSQKIVIPIGIAVLVISAFVGGVFFAKPPLLTGTNPANQNDVATTKSYTNQQLHFTLQYPASFDDVEESPSKVTFRPKGAEDLTGFGVLMEKTSYSTTQDWLKAQPKGSASSAGYQPVFWIGGPSLGKLIVAEYIVVDQNGRQPIYGKTLSMVVVQNGMLYKIPVGHDFPTNETPAIGSDMIGIIDGFQAL